VTGLEMNKEEPMGLNVRDGPLQVEVWGDLACFTRPEMKVERVSYPVMTPTAARGVLEAIFWKPEFAWRVEEIAILSEVRYISLLRNEVNSRASERVARSWSVRGEGGFRVDDDRAQRHTLALRDVAYRITAHIELRPGATDNVAKYRDQFRRRVQAGRCFQQPYLGCREFVAAFGPATQRRAIDSNEDMGSMLLDLEYGADGRATPRFFDARLEGGVLRVPLEREVG
jgi:CRISPR-associated protein Cas5d